MTVMEKDYETVLQEYKLQDKDEELLSSIYIAYDKNSNGQDDCCCQCYNGCCNNGQDSTCESCCADCGIGTCCCGC